MPRDKTANHIRLMAAARQEFLEYGFEKASMRSIGERCGLTAAGIYRHCRDKEDLFEQLVMHSVLRIDEWLAAHVARYVDTVQKGHTVTWRDSEIDMMREIVYPNNLQIIELTVKYVKNAKLCKSKSFAFSCFC